jgi:sugar O-acyltransferase (sialic acid O-acetyltransferase NeuD family)
VKKVIVWGDGMMADFVYASLIEDPAFEGKIVAFTLDAAYIRETPKFGLPVFAFDDIEKKFPPQEHEMIVAVGYRDLNSFRAQKCEAAKQKGYKLYSHICSGTKIFSNVSYGENCFVADGVSIQPFVSIGDNTFVFGGAAIGHHARLGSGCWITSGAVIGGNATLGDRAFLGLNATIANDIAVGHDNFIGAMALVNRSTNDGEVYISPAAVKHRMNSKQFIAFAGF